MLSLLQATKNAMLLLANSVIQFGDWFWKGIYFLLLLFPIEYSVLLLIYFFSISYNAKILQILALDPGEILILTTVAFTQCLLWS